MALLKATLPGSISFLLIVLVLGIGLLQHPRTHPWGRRTLYGLFVLYVCISIPALSALLVAPLAWGLTPLQAVDASRNVEAIVVLDAGTHRIQHEELLLELPNAESAMRALEAVRLYQLFDDPLVIVSGGDPDRMPHWSAEASTLRDALMRSGVPPQRIILDSESDNTRAHAVNILAILKEQNVSLFALVTSPTHIRRSLLAFRAVGADPIASPTGTLIDDKDGWRVLWPSLQALSVSEAAIHDYLGLVYYSVLGWN